MHRVGQQAQRSHRAALDVGQHTALGNDIQKFVAPTADLTCVAHDDGDLAQDGIHAQALGGHRHQVRGLGFYMNAGVLCDGIQHGGTDPARHPAGHRHRPGTHGRQLLRAPYQTGTTGHQFFKGKCHGSQIHRSIVVDGDGQDT